MHIHERNAERKRLNGLMLKSSMKVYAAFGDLGKKVFADGARRFSVLDQLKSKGR